MLNNPFLLIFTNMCAQVVNYVVEKLVLDKPLDNVNTDGTLAPGIGGPLQHPVVGDGSFRSGLKPWQKHKPSIEILCNNQVILIFHFIKEMHSKALT